MDICNPHCQLLQKPHSFWSPCSGYSWDTEAQGKFPICPARCSGQGLKLSLLSPESLIFCISQMVLNASCSPRCKGFVPKPYPASQSQLKARVTLLKAEVLPRKEESRKQCQKKVLLPAAVILSFARRGSFQHLGVVGWLFPDRSRKLEYSGLRKLYIFYHWRQWAPLGLPETEHILGPHAKNGPLWIEKEDGCKDLKGGGKANSIWPRGGGCAVGLWSSPGSHFPRKWDDLENRAPDGRSTHTTSTPEGDSSKGAQNLQVPPCGQASCPCA